MAAAATLGAIQRAIDFAEKMVGVAVTRGVEFTNTDADTHAQIGQFRNHGDGAEADPECIRSFRRRGDIVMRHNHCKLLAPKTRTKFVLSGEDMT